MAANQQDDERRPRISMIGQVQQKWEYWQEAECTPARLNQLGQQGWRLVGPPVVARVTLGTSGKLLYVFERPVQVNHQ